MDPLVPPIPGSSRWRSRVRRRVKKDSQTDLNILSTFKLTCQSKKWPFITRYKTISSIVPVNDKTAWFSYYGWHKIYLVTSEGRMEQMVEMNSNITHVAATLDGTLFVTSDMGYSVQKLTLKGQVCDWYTTSPSLTRGICICKNEDLLLCVVGDGGNKVLRISKTGQKLKEFEFGESERRLFRYPYHVKENVNGNICVTDIDANCLVVLNENGEKRFRYHGCNRPEIMCKFCPYGVACSIHGNIILTDYWNHCIHILDRDGNFLNFLLTQVYRLEYPLAVGTDSEDCVWVGCKSGKVIVCQALV